MDFEELALFRTLRKNAKKCVGLTRLCVFCAFLRKMRKKAEKAHIAKKERNVLNAPS
jgi:hypothetical protein